MEEESGGFNLANKEAIGRKKSSKKLKLFDGKIIVGILIGIVLTIAAFFGVKAIISAQSEADKAIDFSTILDISEYIENVDFSWKITAADPSLSEMSLEPDLGFDNPSLLLQFHKIGANDFTFEGPNGEMLILTISIDKDNNISIIRR